MQRNDATTSARDAAEELVAALSALRVRAGDPSLRQIASKIAGGPGGRISHTTVADALSGRRVPSWPAVAAIVRALEGDEQTFRRAWVEATERPATPTASERQEVLFVTRYRRAAADFFSSSLRHSPGSVFGESSPRVVNVSDTEERQSEQDVASFDNEIRHTLLLGSVGSGKTVLSQLLALRHALNEAESLAFLLPLRHVIPLGAPSTSVVGFIEQNLEGVFQLRPPTGAIEQHLQREATLVIFDGLDEFADNERSTLFASIIRLFSREYPLARILVTSADPSHRGLFDPNAFTTFMMARGGYSIPQAIGRVPDDVLALVDNIRDLMRHSVSEPNAGRGAVALGWATLENCLLRLLGLSMSRESSENRPLERPRVMELVKFAQQIGLLEAEDVQKLDSSWMIRNQILHQPSATASSSAVVEAAEAVIQAITKLYDNASDGKPAPRLRQGNGDR